VKQRGRDWAANLANFLCLQLTDRSFDLQGPGLLFKRDRSLRNQFGRQIGERVRPLAMPQDIAVRAAQFRCQGLIL